MKRILHHPTVKKHLPQLIKFVVSGVCGASVDLSSQWVLVEIWKINPFPAFIMSACAGAIIVFIFNKFITFQSHHQKISKELAKFAVVYIPAIGLNFVLSSFFFWLGLSHEFAKAAAIAIGAILNYLFSHFFIFRRKNPETPVV